MATKNNWSDEEIDILKQLGEVPITDKWRPLTREDLDRPLPRLKVFDDEFEPSTEDKALMDHMMVLRDECHRQMEKKLQENTGFPFTVDPDPDKGSFGDLVNLMGEALDGKD